MPWRLTPIEAFFIVESDFDPSGQAFNVGQKATKASPENVQLDHFIQGPYASFQFQIEYAKHDKRTFEVFTTSRLDIPLHGLLSSHQDRHLAFYGNVAVLQRNTSRNESLTYQNLSSESGNEVLATLLRYGYTGPAREIQAHSADRGAGTPVTSTVDASTQTDLVRILPIASHPAYLYSACEPPASHY